MLYRIVSGSGEDRIKSFDGIDRAIDFSINWASETEWSVGVTERKYTIMPYFESGVLDLRNSRCITVTLDDCKEKWCDFLWNTIWKDTTDDDLHKAWNVFVNEPLPRDRVISHADAWIKLLTASNEWLKNSKRDILKKI